MLNKIIYLKCETIFSGAVLLSHGIMDPPLEPPLLQMWYTDVNSSTLAIKFIKAAVVLSYLLTSLAPRV